jgi:lipoyl(octanoyl) transferase
MLQKINIWLDHKKKSGSLNMATDHWLLENYESPLLRVYRWKDHWGSLGYFSKIEKKERIDSNCKMEWVRRWTGGGIVDHRNDWTYTLIIPFAFLPKEWKGAESYCVIHKALAAALREEGKGVQLSCDNPGVGEGICFQHPVLHDLVHDDCTKLAGAGQRRTKKGLLHQGSVLFPAEDSEKRAILFAGNFSLTNEIVDVKIDHYSLEYLVEKYPVLE